MGLITGSARIGVVDDPQRYRAYPGVMEVEQDLHCNDNCDIAPLTATAGELFEFADDDVATLPSDLEDAPRTGILGRRCSRFGLRGTTPRK